MQISEVAQHWQEFKDTGQIEVFETVSQALHVIKFITKKLFNFIDVRHTLRKISFKAKT